MKWFSLPQLTPLIGVDLGSSRTRIWCSGKGVIIDEPTIVATEVRSKKVLAVGHDALEMEGRVQPQIKIHHPLKNGKIYDASVVKAMLQVWLQQILGWKYLMSPIFMVSVPAGSTQASRAAVTQLFYQLGAREVYTIAQPLAAAIGAGVPIADASGTLVFYLGAGVVEAGIISLGSLVQLKSKNMGGEFLDLKLGKLIKNDYQLELGRQTIANLKHQLFLTISTKQIIKVVGQDAMRHTPREVGLEVARFNSLGEEFFKQQQLLCQELLADIYPELTADILDKGMLLAGGLAQLTGLDHWLAQELKIPVSVVENPDLVVIDGIALAAQNLTEFEQSLGYQEV